jgi:hypothetical protein
MVMRLPDLVGSPLSLDRDGRQVDFVMVEHGEPLLLVECKLSDAGFRPPDPVQRLVGAGIVGYALVVYPLLNVLLGHRYPAMPTFGAPCPTTIATFGLLTWATPRPPWFVWPIPILWALVGTSAAFTLGGTGRPWASGGRRAGGRRSAPPARRTARPLIALHFSLPFVARSRRARRSAGPVSPDPRRNSVDLSPFPRSGCAKRGWRTQKRVAIR